MESVIELITNNGLSVVCVAYLIYFQNTTMKQMLNTLTTINDRLMAIEHKIDVKEVK